MLQKVRPHSDFEYQYPHPVSNKAPEYSSLDLFSGAGGLSIGLQMAGFESVAAIEYDSHAARTYASNFPQTDVYNTDIRDIDANEVLKKSKLRVGELDLSLIHI